MFPEIAQGINEFNFTYLHPGTYYLTCVADINGDGYASKGDVSSKSLLVEVKANSKVTSPLVQVKFQN